MQTGIPTQSDENVLVGELEHGIFHRSYISEQKIKEIATEKYNSSGYGITFENLTTRLSIKKPQAQRSLKHFHERGVLFTAEDLISQGLDLIQNTSPQQYFPTCIRADIIEGLKKRRNVLVEPTEVTTSKGSVISSSLSTSKYPLSNSLEYQKAQSFLDVLTQLPFAPPYIHKLQLTLSINKQYYQELAQKEGHINRAKRHEEIIGRRHVIYTFSPNGTVEIAVKSSDTPFKVETDEDEIVIFSFLGQVRDRLLYHVSDIKERHIPDIMAWILKACDLNKDVIIDDKAQLTLPDIQLKYADRVFRLYVKSLHDKAVYRNEESLKLNLIMPTALDNIRDPYKSIGKNIEDLTEAIKQINTKIDSISKCNCKNSNSLPDNYLDGINLQ